MFISNYIILKNSISEIYEHISQNNRLVVKGIIQSFEESIRDINNLIYSIHTLQESYSDSAKGRSSREDMYNIYTLQRNISGLVTSKEYIEEVIVFYKDSDLAITTKGTIDFKTLISNQYYHPVYTADYWRAFIASSSQYAVMPEQIYRGATTEGYRYLSKRLMMFIGNDKFRSSEKNIMIVVDVNKLLDHVKQTSMTQGTELIILDHEKNVILSTEQDLTLVDVLNEIYSNPAQEATLKKKDFQYHFFQSSYNDFYYIDKMPYEFTDINTASKANLYILAVTIICAVILAVILSIYLFRPLKRIMSLFGYGPDNYNGFKHVYLNIVKMQKQNQMLLEQQAWMKEDIRRGLFLHSLNLSAAQDSELERQIRLFLSDLFVKPYFMLLSVQAMPQRIHTALDEMRPADFKERIRMEFSQLHHDVHVFHKEDYSILILIGMLKKNERKEILVKVRKLVDKLYNDPAIPIPVLAAASHSYTSKVDHAYGAYKDLLCAMAYRNVQNASSLIDIQTIEWTNKLYLPLDQLEKLSNFVMNGQEAEGMSIIKQIIGRNVEYNIHYEQLQVVVKLISYHITKHMDNTDRNSQWDEAIRAAEQRLNQYTMTFTEANQYLLKLLHVAAEKKKQTSNSKLSSEAVIQYIEQHHADNLYLGHMAEAFETTPKYFSNYFTRTFGVNYIEYLNKVRVTHAKTLLQQTSLSIAEISEKVGYSNSSTFTTTFKKYIGLSPTEYRRNHKEE